MNLDDIFDGKRTPLEKRRVCPVRECYKACLDLYLKYNLTDIFLAPVTALPNELKNVGKKLGYQDMHALSGQFSRIELHALNESTRKGGNPIPNEQMNSLLASFKAEDWIYFDSEFNTCFLKDLDTQDEPKDYFTHYYGDYQNGFINAKMQEASKQYGGIFLDTHTFMYWLTHDQIGKAYRESLPSVESARLFIEGVALDSWDSFDHLGPA